jgi:hypothetical protein
VPSSCSEGGDSEEDGCGRKSPIFEMLLESGKAGDVSPNATCMQRSLSSVVVSDYEARHELLEGRPKIVCGIRSIPLPSLQRAVTVPTHILYANATSHPAPLRLDAWSEAVAGSFAVRGAHYLRDAKKGPSAPSLFKLLTIDLVSAHRPNFRGLCAHPAERIQTALRDEQATGIQSLPAFVFAVNLCVPAQGSSSSSSTAPASACYHWVAYFGIEDKNLITTDKTAIGRLCNKFFFGDSDTFRDSTFKLVPRITDGNFVVRKAVGSKPSILGRKLKQHYIRTDRYLELIVDIGSDSVATRIVKLALGYAKSLTIDMMFLLEGKTESTLPERILGGVRVKNVDFKQKDGQRFCSEIKDF